MRIPSSRSVPQEKQVGKVRAHGPVRRTRRGGLAPRDPSTGSMSCSRGLGLGHHRAAEAERDTVSSAAERMLASRGGGWLSGTATARPKVSPTRGRARRPRSHRCPTGPVRSPSRDEEGVLHPPQTTARRPGSPPAPVPAVTGCRNRLRERERPDDRDRQPAGRQADGPSFEGHADRHGALLEH